MKKSHKLILITLIVCLIILIFQPIRPVLTALLLTFYTTWKLFLDLLFISVIIFIIAAFLSPLEALGWWAGWYGDTVDIELDPGTVQTPLPEGISPRRYIIYLDGIGQSQFEYIPEVDVFLNELSNRLPNDVLIIRGLMPYSVRNEPLTESRILGAFWRMADATKMSGNANLIATLAGFAINMRNLFVVAVSADQRYGPIYNQGIAQVMYNSLINHGYQPNSGIPITLIGYSGGGQISSGCIQYLKDALKSPIDIISISGVFCGHNHFLNLEHLYHFVGDKDTVERAGPIFFPRRWSVFFLSYWNRAKRRGKVTVTSLGPVAHNEKYGPFDGDNPLPNGQTSLENTLNYVTGIITGNWPKTLPTEPSALNNYERYQEAPFNHPDYYPLNQPVNTELYRPIAPWIGRLVLPKSPQERSHQGVFFEVHYAESPQENLVGKIVNLRWSEEVDVQNYLRKVTKDVHFNEEALYTEKKGIIHPSRLNGWKQVNPLESLAGARSVDDMLVMLPDPVIISPPLKSDGLTTLIINREPTQITGRFYALVKIIASISPQNEHYQVIHFNPQSRQFDGVEEIVKIPQVIPNEDNNFSSVHQSIENSPVNDAGWYIYGAKNAEGMFIVQSLAPRALLRLQPQEIVFGKKSAFNYIKKQSWNVANQKGKIQSVLLTSQSNTIEAALGEWRVGDRALLIHVYGGIGGENAEPATKGPIYFGHFAYGQAQVIREPLTNELSFNIIYDQIYGHNVDGIISGVQGWNRYMGDRQHGWLGMRPVCDLIIKWPPFTDVYYTENGVIGSPLDILIQQLQIMMARYRIGDGNGGTYVGPANNCSQDSNQALYTAIKTILSRINSSPERQNWSKTYPQQEKNLQQLEKLGKGIKQSIFPWGSAREDWQNQTENLGLSLEDEVWDNLLRGIASWPTLLPRLASDTISRQFIDRGASVWVLSTTQVGGDNPLIAPVIPMTLP